MTLFLRELARNKKSFIIWTIVLVGFNLMMLSFFPTMSQNAQKINDMIKSYPKAMAEAFGIGKLNLAEILGFYGMEAYLFVTLLGSIAAMILSASILSKEESDKTIEFLYAKPITRNRIVASKALLVLSYVLALNLIVFVTNLVFFEMFKKEAYSMAGLLTITAGGLLLHLTFAALGFLISVFIVKARSVYPVALGVVIGTFFLNIISGATEQAENLKYLSPFKYVDAADLILNRRIQGVYLAIMGVVIVASVVLTFVLYKRKNITV